MAHYLRNDLSLLATLHASLNFSYQIITYCSVSAWLLNSLTWLPLHSFLGSNLADLQTFVSGLVLVCLTNFSSMCLRTKGESAILGESNESKKMADFFLVNSSFVPMIHWEPTIFHIMYTAVLKVMSVSIKQQNSLVLGWNPKQHLSMGQRNRSNSFSSLKPSALKVPWRVRRPSGADMLGGG